ncbi:MAG: hypothetical protein NC337_09050 [Roseburia sp.]|nr:hypothetical protein [Roseburia sp.]
MGKNRRLTNKARALYLYVTAEKERGGGNGESVSGLVNRLLAVEVPGFDPIFEKYEPSQNPVDGP